RCSTWAGGWPAPSTTSRATAPARAGRPWTPRRRCGHSRPGWRTTSAPRSPCGSGCVTVCWPTRRPAATPSNSAATPPSPPTTRSLALVEVPEGWAHLGTTLNGQSQPVCTFLGKGPPSSTVTQEGLAVLTEFLTFVSHPGRVRRLVRRIEAAALAEGGADFLD